MPSRLLVAPRGSLLALLLCLAACSDDPEASPGANAGQAGTGGGQAGKSGQGGLAGSSGQGGASAGGAQAGQGGSAQAGKGGSAQAGQTGGGAAGSSGSSGQQGAGSPSAGQAGAAGSGQAGSAQAGNGQAGSNQGGSNQGGSGTGPRLGDWLGMNGFVNDPDELLAAGGVVREYHSWDWNQHYWDQTGEHHTGVDAMVFQGMVSTWDLDDFYDRMKKAKIDVFPALQGTTTAVSGSLDFPKPMPMGADPLAPASYADHARMMYQFAARYGSVAVDASKLTLAEGQPVRSGLGYLRYLENGNEPDNTFGYGLNGQAFPQTAEEFAAMSSADYDGHQGKLGAGVGMKGADPQMQMVMAGLAGSHPGGGDPGWLANVKSYLQGIKGWADQHRGGSFPADVINVHFYCLDYGLGHGMAPEACKLEEQIREARKISGEVAPGKPFWLTEFGYDRVQGSSWNEATPVGPYDAETVQAQWLIRGTFAILLAGADRFTMYMSRDAGTDGLFATSGLGRVDLSSQKLGKLAERYAAFDYFSTLHLRLGAMRLEGEVPSGHPSVRVVSFVADDGQRGYALWSPTADGTHVDGHTLAIGGAASARQITLAKGAPQGNESSLSVTDGKVVVNVSENPVLVLAP